jgi:hypothetical protein
MQDYGGFQLLAGSGEFVWQRHAPSSRFSHDAEDAVPFLYHVELPDLNLSVSATGTTRCGAIRFVFRKGGAAEDSVYTSHESGASIHSLHSARSYGMDGMTPLGE